MNQRSLLFAQFGVIAILVGFHLVAVINFLYWRMRWLDVPAHLLGGLWSGLFAAWILALLKIPPRIILCAGIALVFGVVWESFEATTGITNFPADILDTLKDLSMSTLGGLMAFFLANKLVNS